MKTIVAILSIAWAIIRECFRNLNECPYWIQPSDAWTHSSRCRTCGKCFNTTNNATRTK